MGVVIPLDHSFQLWLRVRWQCAAPNRQLCMAVKPIYPLVIDAWELRAQQVVDASIAETAMHLRDLNDLDAERLCMLSHQERIAVAIR